MKTQIKTDQELIDIRKSGKILATILAELSNSVRVGQTTASIDDQARRLLEVHGAQAAFLDYQGFPATICVSVNDEIAHGIPDSRIIQDGDIVHLDFGVTYNGMITDAGCCVMMGKPTADQKRLLDGTQAALQAAIAQVNDGVRIGDIGSVVEKTLDKYQLKCVYELCGHGVGHMVHEEPTIPNYGYPGTGQSLQAGMTIALEPNVTLGSHEMYLADNGWTWMSKDGSLAAQYEHTVLVTPDGYEILTTL